MNENRKSFTLRPLSSDHNRAHFSSGVEQLDRYLRQQAGQDRRRDIAQVWILEELESKSIAGFYTLSAAEIELNRIPDNLQKRLPRYPALPALLIGRLAVDLRFQGSGLGEMLLFDAFRRACDLGEQAGVYALLVDAKDEEARSFYERYGFIRTDDPFLLMIPLSSIHDITRASR